MFQINSISQARTEFQKLFKKAVLHNQEFLAENAKETTSDETVSIIRTKLLDEWLDRAYTFNPVWEYDEENKLWSVTLPEIRLYTDAPTKVSQIAKDLGFKDVADMRDFLQNKKRKR